MHHVLANSSTGCEAVDCSRKNGVSGQPNAVALRRFVSTNDCDLGLSKIAFLTNRLNLGRPDATFTDTSRNFWTSALFLLPSFFTEQATPVRGCEAPKHLEEPAPRSNYY